MATLLAVETGIGGKARQMTFFAEGAIRCMTAHAVLAGLYLADAASDTAGNVGAVHHDISPEAYGIS
jgi:hypothetical protein